MQFLYGNNIVKSGLGRITENTPAYTGVVIYSMSDVPLGFGVTGKSTEECRTADPGAIVAFHQADVGKCMSHTCTQLRVHGVGECVVCWTSQPRIHVHRLHAPFPIMLCSGVAEGQVLSLCSSRCGFHA